MANLKSILYMIFLCGFKTNFLLEAKVWSYHMATLFPPARTLCWKCMKILQWCSCNLKRHLFSILTLSKLKVKLEILLLHYHHGKFQMFLLIWLDFPMQVWLAILMQSFKHFWAQTVLSMTLLLLAKDLQTKVWLKISAN